MHGPSILDRSARAALSLAVVLAALDASAQQAPDAAGPPPGSAPVGAQRDGERGPAAERTLRLAAATALEQAVPAPALRYKDTPPPPGLWRRPAGKWATAVGAVLLAGGVTVAALNRRLASDLDDRYFGNGLRAADASSYDRVDTYNVLSAALFAAGGAAAGVGIVLWSTAPEEPGARAAPSLGVHGRF